MKVLALNAGSNSLKFQVVESASEGDQFGTAVVSGGYDNIGTDKSVFILYDGKAVQKKEAVEVKGYGQAAKLLFDWLPKSGSGRIERIGHRVVHGGDVFKGPVRVTDEVVGAIEDLADLAPLITSRRWRSLPDSTSHPFNSDSARRPRIRSIIRLPNITISAIFRTHSLKSSTKKEFSLDHVH